MKKLFLLLSAMTVFASCEKDEIDIHHSNEIHLENDYLSFPSEEDFWAKVKSTQSETSDQLNTWEGTLGFKSLRSFYDQTMDEDGLYQESLSNSLTEEEINKIIESGEVPHIKAIPDNPNLFYSNEDGGVELNLFDPSIAALLNTKKVVKIAGALHQFNRSNIKVILDGDESKLPQLKNIGEDNKDTNFRYTFVNMINYSQTKSQNNAFTLNIYLNGDSKTIPCSKTIGKERVKGEIKGANLRYFDYLRGKWMFRTYLYAYARNEYKSWWRGWELKRTSALQMVIHVNYSYGVTSGSSHVRVHTGGNLFRTMTYTFFSTGWQTTNYGGFRSSGEITFYGRSGTQCTL